MSIPQPRCWSCGRWLHAKGYTRYTCPNDGVQFTWFKELPLSEYGYVPGEGFSPEYKINYIDHASVYCPSPA